MSIEVGIGDKGLEKLKEKGNFSMGYKFRDRHDKCIISTKCSHFLSQNIE